MVTARGVADDRVLCELASFSLLLSLYASQQIVCFVRGAETMADTRGIKLFALKFLVDRVVLA